MTKFFEILNRMKGDMTQKELAEVLGRKQGVVQRWLNDEATPHKDVQEKVFSILTERRLIKAGSIPADEDKLEGQAILKLMFERLKKTKNDLHKLSECDRKIAIAKLEVGLRLFYVPKECDEIIAWLQEKP
jgi:transcriptional regulator with XRE-family HTH domain